MSNICAPLIDRDYGIYVEEYFGELLRVERKRSERSTNPFMMMLFDISTLEESGEKEEITKKIIGALQSSIRDIDLMGWYNYQTVIGVVFREMKPGHGSSKKIRDIVMRRIYENIGNYFSIEQMKQVLVSCHSFPESNVPDVSNAPLDPSLYPDISLSSKSPLRVLSFFIKTLIDVLGSLFLVTLLLPVFIIIAALVKLSSKGPILFEQERIGLFGKPFVFFKFRSMYINQNHNIHKMFVKNFIKETANENEELGSNNKKTVYKMTDDPRVTKIGSFLRKTSLDELPQLFNVLKGDMSLVGPRPPIPYEYEQYDIWHKGRIVEFKPGITGLWQVEGRSRTTFNEMVRLDLKYIREWSLWLDIKILLKTPWVVIKGKGAY
jgi:lipopolysaccharide/colanic/teichoic acid biosynthesis glycosyltransferase